MGGGEGRGLGGDHRVEGREVGLLEGLHPGDVAEVLRRGLPDVVGHLAPEGAVGEGVDVDGDPGEVVPVGRQRGLHPVHHPFEAAGHPHVGLEQAEAEGPHGGWRVRARRRPSGPPARRRRRRRRRAGPARPRPSPAPGAARRGWWRGGGRGGDRPTAGRRRRAPRDRRRPGRARRPGGGPPAAPSTSATRSARATTSASTAAVTAPSDPAGPRGQVGRGGGRHHDVAPGGEVLGGLGVVVDADGLDAPLGPHVEPRRRRRRRGRGRGRRRRPRPPRRPRRGPGRGGRRPTGRPARARRRRRASSARSASSVRSTTASARPGGVAGGPQDRRPPGLGPRPVARRCSARSSSARARRRVRSSTTSRSAATSDSTSAPATSTVAIPARSWRRVSSTRSSAPSTRADHVLDHVGQPVDGHHQLAVERHLVRGDRAEPDHHRLLDRAQPGRRRGCRCPLLELCQAASRRWRASASSARVCSAGRARPGGGPAGRAGDRPRRPGPPPRRRRAPPPRPCGRVGSVAMGSSAAVAGPA